MMRTPSGKECKFYYEDYHRGREQRECRLITAADSDTPWKPNDCKTCTVPDILWANASEYLAFKLKVFPGILGLGRRVDVSVICTKHEEKIEDPFIGCSLCASERPDLSAFVVGDDS